MNNKEKLLRDYITKLELLNIPNRLDLSIKDNSIVLKNILKLSADLHHNDEIIIEIPNFIDEVSSFLINTATLWISLGRPTKHKRIIVRGLNNVTKIHELAFTGHDSIDLYIKDKLVISDSKEIHPRAFSECSIEEVEISGKQDFTNHSAINKLTILDDYTGVIITNKVKYLICNIDQFIDYMYVNLQGENSPKSIFQRFYNSYDPYFRSGCMTKEKNEQIFKKFTEFLVEYTNVVNDLSTWQQFGYIHSGDYKYIAKYIGNKSESQQAIINYHETLNKKAILGINENNSDFEFKVIDDKVWITRIKLNDNRRIAIPEFVYGIDDYAFDDLDHGPSYKFVALDGIDTLTEIKSKAFHSINSIGKVATFNIYDELNIYSYKHLEGIYGCVFKTVHLHGDYDTRGIEIPYITNLIIDDDFTGYNTIIPKTLICSLENCVNTIKNYMIKLLSSKKNRSNQIIRRFYIIYDAYAKGIEQKYSADIDNGDRDILLQTLCDILNTKRNRMSLIDNEINFRETFKYRNYDKEYILAHINKPKKRK